MDFFDSNCSIGMRSIFIKGSFCDVDSLITEMNKCNISDALVYHSLAQEYQTIIGNDTLMSKIKKFVNLHPVWVVLPNNTGEFYNPEILLKLMKLNNVKMVRMFPGKDYHNFSIFNWCCGTLLAMLNEHRIPIMMGMEQLDYDYNVIYNLANEYKDLPLILTNAVYKSDRYLYPLLEKFNNVYIETSTYKVYFGIEAICNKFGAKKFIFGTGLPIFSAGSAVATINYLTLKDEEKNLIAEGNIKRLMGDISYE